MLCSISLAACAASEYTTTHAQSDLAKQGFTQQQAKCLLDGLRKQYADQYIKLNNEQKVDRVNPAAVALYVRNVFASPGSLSGDEVAFARSLAHRCRP